MVAAIKTVFINYSNHLNVTVQRAEEELLLHLCWILTAATLPSAGVKGVVHF